MSRQVIWSTEAAADLEDIVNFIARDSPHHARQVATDVLETVERLRAMPRSARVAPEFDDDDIRDVTIYSYRLFYRVTAEAIQIAAIVHGARDVRSQISKRFTS